MLSLKINKIFRSILLSLGFRIKFTMKKFTQICKFNAREVKAEMESMKINKILTVLLLMIVISIGYANKPQPPLQTFLEEHLSIVGNYPKLGDIFEVVYRIKAIETKDWTQRQNYLSADYVAVIRFSPGAVEIIDQDKFYFSGLSFGEYKEFHFRGRIIKAINIINIDGYLHRVIQGKFYGPVTSGPYTSLRLLDPQTGQYGTKEEYEGNLPIEYRYDPVDGSFTCSPTKNPAPVEENLRIIKMIKQLEPALSDSEALLLHSDQYRVGVPEGLPRWDEKNKRWLEEEIFEYYLKDGWLKALREGRREEWIRDEKSKIGKARKGGSPIFFRPDNSHNRGDNYCTGRVEKNFYGWWRYKDHNYNKDQGLLATAVKHPIGNGKTRLLMTYMYNTVYYRVLTDYDVTDDSGFFCITFDIPQGSTGCKAYPIIYPSGPDPSSPKINISDPDITQPDYWKDSDDPTLFIMQELGVPTYHDYLANALPCTLGVIWTDTFPQVAQPKSGCINIYETYLHARTFMNPQPNWPLRILWEPGYDTSTYYRNDTIKVIGEPNVPIEDTDEWDDDVLLHEFGHYLMDNYAQIPLNLNPNHFWNINDSIYPNTAYCEGWASFFSGRARVNSGTDSLHVDNKYIGSGSSILWLNFENPWLGSYFDTLDFEGGRWCEGFVTGSLWDIYDSHNEAPYHSYPWSDFPDTGLRDTLTMGFDPIWDVFDNYDPPGTPTHCWTIFHFRSGWNSYNYDHAFALNQILLHHRIRDTIPAAPTGLSATSILGDVRLYWHKNSEPDLQGYRVFRRDSTIMNPTPGWTSWALLVEKNTDTTHLDTTTVSGGKYRYRLTAFDSLGNESGYSDSVSIKVRGKGDIDKQPPFGLTKTIVRDAQGIEFFIPEGRKEVFVKVYDCCGRIVNQQRTHVGSSNLCEISLKNNRFDHLPSGVYFLSLETDKSDKTVEKFVIVK